MKEAIAEEGQIISQIRSEEDPRKEAKMEQIVLTPVCEEGAVKVILGDGKRTKKDEPFHRAAHVVEGAAKSMGFKASRKDVRKPVWELDSGMSIEVFHDFCGALRTVAALSGYVSVSAPKVKYHGEAVNTLDTLSELKRDYERYSAECECLLEKLKDLRGQVSHANDSLAKVQSVQQRTKEAIVRELLKREGVR